MFLTPNIKKLSSVLCLGVCALGAHAESADRHKPITLEADSVLVDDKQKTSLFEGKVHLVQGTLSIRAERIVITHTAKGIKHCSATGNLAQFRQKMDDSPEYMEGYGERIEYDTQQDTIDFYGQAHVKRRQDTAQGDFITYNTRTGAFQARSNNTSGDSNPGRVRIIMQPEGGSDPAPSSRTPKP